jgi:hypothetical protein
MTLLRQRVAGRMRESETRGFAAMTQKRLDVAGVRDDDLLDRFRRNPRSSHPAKLVRQDGTEDAVTITEYSPGGFRLTVSTRPTLGEDIRIRVTGEPDVPGRIRWAYGEEAGGSF